MYHRGPNVLLDSCRRQPLEILYIQIFVPVHVAITNDETTKCCQPDCCVCTRTQYWRARAGQVSSETIISSTSDEAEYLGKLAGTM